MKAFFKGFGYAGRGLWFCIRQERNFRIHLVAAVYVLAAAPFFSLSRGEWAALLLVIGLVIAAEALNTAVEQTVNLASPERHTVARIAKDVAAGAVLLCALTALGVAGCLFTQPAGWQRLGQALLDTPWCGILLIVSIVPALWFVFGLQKREH